MSGQLLDRRGVIAKPIATGTVFVRDTFTDTAAVALASHVGETGATWTKHPSDASAAVITNGNRLRSNTAGSTALFYASGAPTTAEYDVQADFVYIATPSTIFTGVAGRCDTTINTLYIARYDLGNTRWQLLRLIAGVSTSMGTFTQTLIVGVTYAVKLQIRDAAKKVFIDGVERISDTDNTITAAGKAAVRLSDGAATNLSGIHVDNFIATNV